jgi:hypothetical protein
MNFKILFSKVAGSGIKKWSIKEGMVKADI